MTVADIFRNLNLSAGELARIEAEFTEVHYHKGDVVLDIGSTVIYQYYVQRGCLRTYFIDQKAKEYTLQFGIKDWWVSDYTAYFSGGKAIVCIECLEDATLFRMSRSGIEALCRDIPPLEAFMRKKVEGGFCSLQKRILSNLADSAEERYLAFLKDYPEIERIVKNYHIASYLGITTESLSRIRKQLSRR